MAEDSREQREKIGELRDKANEIQNIRETVDGLLHDLATDMQRLSDEWNDPAVADIGAIIAQVMRQTRGANETLGGMAQNMHSVADQAEDRLRQAPPDDDTRQNEQEE